MFAILILSMPIPTDNFYTWIALDAPPQSAGERQADYVGYRASGDWRTDTYELSRDELTQGGPEILGPARRLSEFGGPIFRCNDPNYFCYVTGLVVAIPRSGSAAFWTVGRVECRVLDAPGLLPDRVVRILCRRDASNSVEFSYSRARGIISYRRQCPMCFSGEYDLVGQTGLFAATEAQESD
jgi:hypothetical protein